MNTSAFGGLKRKNTNSSIIKIESDGGGGETNLDDSMMDRSMVSLGDQSMDAGSDDSGVKQVGGNSMLDGASAYSSSDV